MAHQRLDKDSRMRYNQDFATVERISAGISDSSGETFERTPVRLHRLRVHAVADRIRHRTTDPEKQVQFLSAWPSQTTVDLIWSVVYRREHEEVPSLR